MTTACPRFFPGGIRVGAPSFPLRYTTPAAETARRGVSASVGSGVLWNGRWCAPLSVRPAGYLIELTFFLSFLSDEMKPHRLNQVKKAGGRACSVYPAFLFLSFWGQLLMLELQTFKCKAVRSIIASDALFSHANACCL
jgi:hypothetical protein